MEIPRRQRLSFKQAGLTVLVAFLLGMSLSLVQVGIDYASEDAAINREIEALLKVTHTPAARIAYNIDEELAQELVLGLIRSPAIFKAEMLDHNGTALASTSRALMNSNYRFISDRLFGATREFEEPLRVDHAPAEHLGTLRLEVDTFAFGNHFLKRSVLTIASGFVRSLLLSLILLVLFHFMLTKPLVALARTVDRKDPRRGLLEPVPCPPGHERDEIGVLIDAINRQRHSIGIEMAQRRVAEEQVAHNLSQLEEIVSARTRELEATNRQLSDSNRNLDKARRTALDMAQQRAAFLAHMSHEIRTPLNGLLGMIALSLDGDLNVQQRQQLEIAHDSGKVLVGLLNDFLDLSKFEAGEYELERIPFDLGGLVEDTASLLSQNAAAAVELTCHIAPELPATLLGDPTRIRQIVSNLLFNALKFTHAGRVDVFVAPADTGVQISIRDTGIGIAEEALPKLFQPFRQASTGTARQFGGTGLGLALTRTLCDAMDGTLNVVSQEGRGSEFSVLLPLAACSPPKAKPAMDGHAVFVGPVGSGLAEMLETWARQWGLIYQIEPEVHRVSEADADVYVAADARTARTLRQQTSRPILLVTTYGRLLRADAAGALQPLEQLARPVSRDALHQTLGRLLTGETPKAKERVDHSLPVPVQCCVLLVEDNPVNQLVAKTMLTRFGYQVALANHGGEALAYLEKHEVDVVLMDCNMPVMDGYEAARRIREEPKWAHLPIIALTANAMPDERDRCKAAGMDDYLAKPFNRDDLRQRLEAWQPTPGG